MPLGDEAAALVSGRLQTALLRESVALVEGGTATPRDVDSVVTTTIGRRLAVGGPFEIWEQIGWDLVQVIAGALLKEISNAIESANARVRGDELASQSPSGLARLEPALDIGRAPADAAGGESERLRQVTAAPEAPECRQTQADALG